MINRSMHGPPTSIVIVLFGVACLQSLDGVPLVQVHNKTLEKATYFFQNPGEPGTAGVTYAPRNMYVCCVSVLFYANRSSSDQGEACTTLIPCIFLAVVYSVLQYVYLYKNTISK